MQDLVFTSMCDVCMCESVPTLHVYMQDLHACSALSVQMFHFVVLLTVIAFMTALTCSHMDTSSVTGSSFQPAKATEMSSNKIGPLPESAP